MFWTKFSSFCKGKGISPTKALNEIGIPTSIIPKWKKGATPRVSTIKRITTHFDLPDNYFEQKNPPTAENGEGLTEQEKYLLKLFRSTDDEGVKAKIIVRVEETISEAEQKALKPDSSAVG